MPEVTQFLASMQVTHYVAAGHFNASRATGPLAGRAAGGRAPPRTRMTATSTRQHAT